MDTRRARPVPDLDILFEWNEGLWEKLFDMQISLIREDIARARVAEKLVLYLSCPLSSRGGGFAAVNVDVARSTERRLNARYGERVWVLNPAQYQMESKEGTGLINRHARALGISEKDLAVLRQTGPIGGDYMRMWTKVLVEDDPIDAPSAHRVAAKNSGRYFDAFYFLGPRDVQAFFEAEGPGSVSAGVEAYFARRFACDPEFRDSFSIPKLEWGLDPKTLSAADLDARIRWEAKRKDLVRFYVLKASATYSKGSHDEWNIAREINRRRIASSGGDPSELLAIFFDGVQVPPCDLELQVTRGYAVTN